MQSILTAHYAYRYRDTRKERKEGDREGGTKVGQQSGSYVKKTTATGNSRPKGVVKRLAESIISTFIRGGNSASWIC